MSVLEAAGMTLYLTTAPPVYAPGGLVAFTPKLPAGITADALTTAETAIVEQGAVLMVVQCLVDEEMEALLLAQGYTFASSWYFGPPTREGDTPYVNGSLPSEVRIRAAAASDVPALLEIGERKREQYEQYSPVFWKKAPIPRQDFSAYVTGQVESGHNIALVAEVERRTRGYIIAQCSNRAEGYVDDYAVTDPATDWPGVGRILLTEAGRLAGERGVTNFAIVSGYEDTPKRQTIESRGFVLRKHWMVKPLGQAA